MKYLILFVIITPIFQKPNLVVNGSFEKPYVNGQLKLENRDSFWTYLNEYEKDYPWTNLYKNKEQLIQDEIFYTSGNQKPYEGTTYSGVGVYDKYTEMREYLIGNLTTKLERGKKYRLTFFASLADSSRYKVNAIGATVVNNEEAKRNNNHGNSNLSIKPVVEHYGKPLDDTAHWMSISGEFIAKGGENRIVIGCFRPDSELVVGDNYRKKPKPKSLGISNTAYYYIDGVSLILLD